MGELLDFDLIPLQPGIRKFPHKGRSFLAIGYGLRDKFFPRYLPPIELSRIAFRV
jgi:hypothetical protein